MRLVTTLAGVALAALSPAARADQCQLVDGDVASWALKLVQKGVNVVSFCELCGDTHASAPAKVAKIEMRSSPSGKSIAINGKEVDLAYTFVQTGKATYTNVAMMAGCPTQDVSPFLAGEKLNGPKAQIATAGLPGTCIAYIDSVQQLGRCEKMPKESRDALLQAVDSVKSSWAQMAGAPPEAIKAMNEACKAGLDAIKQSAASVGCPIQ